MALAAGSTTTRQMATMASRHEDFEFCLDLVPSLGLSQVGVETCHATSKFGLLCKGHWHLVIAQASPDLVDQRQAFSRAQVVQFNRRQE